MTHPTPPVLYISADTSDLTTRFKATPHMHPCAVAYVPEEDTQDPTPAQVELMCLAVEDVIDGRGFTGDAAADLAMAQDHLRTALALTGFKAGGGT